jgi:hypothetical protein
VNILRLAAIGSHTKPFLIFTKIKTGEVTSMLQIR